LVIFILKNEKLFVGTDEFSNYCKELHFSHGGKIYFGSI
jgi:hypothetical protein